MTKKELRNSIRKLKQTYTKTQLQNFSDRINFSIFEDGVWRVTNTILMYYPMPDEVDIRPLILKAKSQGKTVLLPKVVGDDLQIMVYESENSLKQGAYGIYEPDSVIFPETRYSEIDMAIIPGMAFDKFGHRLGRGKGYYDKLLVKMSETFKIGVGFPFQIFEEIPFDEFDIKMDEVVWRD
ncbi:MAG: 5-formyltetrahydrofolate cyclo-ligase [Bacteroidales bacterium]|nr:5-formyltetrahydrofolate cyclo-ligase [Bacteroidales bacterium]